jgi:hypothetical protein
MTDASQLALDGLRDLSTLQWYIIPLLAIVFYIYATEIFHARKTGDWNAIIAGVTLFGADFINETINGWILALSGYSALWTAPGPTALRTMVGWNIEIMFMFSIAGIIFYKTMESADKKILNIPNRWVWTVGYSAFCVFVEVLLNLGGHLVWEYPFWNFSFTGIWLIFLFGYFWFFVITKFNIERKTIKVKILTIAILYSTAIILNIIGMGILKFIY